MKFKCPYCENDGRLNYPKDYVVQDCEMLMGRCSKCRKEFSVTVLIGEKPEE